MRKILISLFMIALIVYLTPDRYVFGEEELSESELEVVIALEKEQVFLEEEFEVELGVKNIADKEKELNFNTGQRFDIIVLGTKEELLYRWSDDKMFTQALGSLVLAPGEEKVYEAKVSLPADISPGDYQIKGLIAAEDQIFSQARTITIKEK